MLLDRGWVSDKVLNEVLVGGMQIVEIDFRDGILFVPEVLLAANAMKGGMPVLLLSAGQAGATFHRDDGRTLHVRKATCAEPAQQAIYESLGIDFSPGSIHKTLV